MNEKRGFTLAEAMIVLVLLGVIAAVTTPIIFNSKPDENKLKFKKAYYTLQRTTDAVLNSDTYPEGDLSKTTNAADAFCMAFSDMLNTTYDDCANSSAANTNGTNAFTYNPSSATSSLDTLDGYCTKTSISDPFDDSSNLPKFITQDGIFWWGFDYDFASPTNSSGIRTDYTIICVDVDGSEDEQPFAFGIRNDGKVIIGNRGREWLREGSDSAIAD